MIVDNYNNVPKSLDVFIVTNLQHWANDNWFIILLLYLHGKLKTPFHTQ